ncbi:PREDICTED: two-component response regulator EHD1-like [Ipomoea nil]|uniref:two-component response regulator EHD1-like n=1 Tax=Ipomoea nil TaxID=35883 RepID=UPI00090101CD|nr:PREDICTED: two-component response regulator EHD1-like [Ipomoea nil]
MGEFGGFCHSFPQVVTDDFQPPRRMHDVHVLIVEHRVNFVANAKEFGTSIIAEILKQFSYEVTVVESASRALSRLYNGEEKFDVLMANFYQPDKKVNVKLLQEAIKRKFLVVQISDEKDENGDEVARSAIEKGVFLYLEKPFPVDMLKYLWQHVYRERRLMNHSSQALNISMAAETLINGQNNIVFTDNQTATDSNNINHLPRRRGAKFKWTEELHAKFIDAVNQLGAGNCYPKEIWEMMKVPGLTREKVASHLQRCRDNKWRPVEEHGNRRRSRTMQFSSSQPRRPRHKNFGFMPVVEETNNKGNMPPQEQIIAAVNDEISSQNDGNNNELGSSVTVSTNSVTDTDVRVPPQTVQSSADIIVHDRRLLDDVQTHPVVTNSLNVDEAVVVNSSPIPWQVAGEPEFDELLDIPEEMLPWIFFGGQQPDFPF